jgi:hypothetical protein
MAAGPFTYPTPPLNMGINATLDEVRISTVARTHGWISTERANQSAPSTFYAVGVEE